MNLVVLQGNIGQDPEIHVFDGGSKKASLSLATSEYYKKDNGEKITKTHWHNLVAFGKKAELIEKFVNKGDRLTVQGSIQYRNYENKEGNKVYVTEIIVSEIVLPPKS